MKKILFFTILTSCGYITSLSPQKTDPTPTPETNCSKALETPWANQILYDCDQKKVPDDSVNESTVGWVVLSSVKNKIYNGVGRYWNCTGTLIQPPTYDNNAPAYVLTNGHCIGRSDLLGATEVLTDQNSFGHTMTFNYFEDSKDTSKAIVVNDKYIRYATMYHTDFSIIELQTTLAQLIKKGVHPFPFAKSPPTFGLEIELVGVPMTGMENANLGLHKSVCNIRDKVSLIEGDYHFSYAKRMDCSIIGGNSGSPIINHNTGEIVAIANTTVNDSALNQENCTLDKPCEVQSNGTETTNLNYNYAEPVSFLSKCFLANGVFSLKATGCDVVNGPAQN